MAKSEAVTAPATSSVEPIVVMYGPWRSPIQLLAEQSYKSHASIHDDSTATDLGFRAGPIEGPTHFSQFVPLLLATWGTAWFEHGCLSAHFVHPAYDGDQLKATLSLVEPLASFGQIRLESEQGETILTGTASIGPHHHVTEIDQLFERIAVPTRLSILDKIAVGDKPPVERAVVRFDEAMPPLYPFSLEQKLAVITELLDWYAPDCGRRNPWGRPILPPEMVSVLTQYTSDGVFPIRQPSVALFVDQEIRFHAGPVFVDTEYDLEREVIALSESRRTESFWVRTDVRDAGTRALVASTVLHTAVLKQSYPGASESEPAESQALPR